MQLAIDRFAEAPAGAIRATSARGRPAAVAARDVPILNFLLLVEHVQAALYVEAAARARRPASSSRGLRGELLRFARVVAPQEEAHVAFLRRTLGPHARRRPVLAFGAAAAEPALFARTALALEDLATGAYIGQGANLTPRSVGGVAAIASVEARHSAWLRDVLGRNPAPHPADAALSPSDVLTAILRTGFVRRA